MALGTREMLLVIRARDEASRVLGRLSNTMRNLDKGQAQAASDMVARGGALVSLGAGITAVGAAGAAWLEGTVEAAGDYETAARRALTQAEGVKISLEEMKQIGRDVARETRAPFSEMQDALHTIFSTIDTDAPGARKLLTGFSKAAVGGQIDLERATQYGLQALNGFRMGAEDVNHVMDVQFALYREGVGGYEQLSAALGKSASSAARADQDIESLSGMLAFLTRSGLTAAMASTSASRAMDLITNSKVGDRLHDIGVETTDASGAFRPMVDIVKDLDKALSGMSSEEKTAKLAALFKGSGNNVQARRFFDLALENFGELKNLTDQVSDNSGAMERAYGIMFEAPATKVQDLNNRYEMMRTEIGEKLLPIKMKLMEVLTGLLDKWDNLSPGMKTAIAYFGAAASALLILVGVVTMVAGAILIIGGTILLFGGALGGIAVGVGIAIAAIAGIGVAVWLIIKYWDQIKAATVAAWNWIKDWFKENLGEQIQAVKDFGQKVWEDLQGFWNDLKDIFNQGMEELKEEWKKWDNLTKPAQELWAKIFPIVKTGFNVLKGIFNVGLKVIGFLWDIFVQPIIDGIKLLFSGIKDIVVGAFQFLRGIFEFFLNLLTGNWSAAWEGLKTAFFGLLKMLGGAVKAIVGGILTWLSVTAVGGIVKMFLGLGRRLLTLGGSAMKLLWKGITGLGGLLKTFGQWLWGLIWNGGVKRFGTMLLDAGKRLLTGLWDGIVLVKNLLLNAPSKIMHWIMDKLTGIGKWLIDSGKALLEGLWKGIQNAAGWLKDKILGWGEDLVNNVKNFFGISSPSKVFREFGKFLIQGFWKGIQDEAPKARKAMQDLMLKIRNSRNLKKGQKADLLDFLEKQNDRVIALAKRSTAAHTALEKARKKLADMVKVRADYIKNVRDAARSFAAITTIGIDEGEEKLTSDMLVRGLQDKLQAIKDFNTDLAALRKAGLSKTMYDQIVQAGVEQGGQIADAIVEGGPAAVRELNSLQSQINSASTTLGTKAGNYMYEAGIQAQKGLVNGLAANARALDAAATRLANKLVRAVKNKLGIKSPSRVFAEMGGNMMLGMAKGIYKSAPTAAEAASHAASLIAGSFNATLDSPHVSTYAATAITPPPVVTAPQTAAAQTARTPVQIEINTQEINPLQHATELGHLIAERVG